MANSCCGSYSAFSSCGIECWMIQRSYKQVLFESEQYTSAQDRTSGKERGINKLILFHQQPLDCRKQGKKPWKFYKGRRKCFNNVMRLPCTGLSDCCKKNLRLTSSSLQKRRTFLTKAFCQCCEGRDRLKLVLLLGKVWGHPSVQNR